MCAPESSEIIPAREDRYQGLIIDSELLAPDPVDFAKQLSTSLKVQSSQANGGAALSSPSC